MRLAKYARKIVVLSIGFPLLLLGIILIPLPGPGLLTSLGALFILSTELDWADRMYDKRKDELKKIYDQSKKKYQPAEDEA